MLKPTVYNGAQELRFQEKVAETSGMDTDVGALLDYFGFSIGSGGRGSCSDGLGDSLFLLLVVDQVVSIFSHGFSTNIRYVQKRERERERETGSGGRVEFIHIYTHTRAHATSNIRQSQPFRAEQQAASGCGQRLLHRVDGHLLDYKLGLRLVLRLR